MAMPGLQLSQSNSAESTVSRKGDVGDVNNATEVPSPGNRGFQNNVAFPGSTLNASQGINDGASKSGWLWAVVAVGAVALLYVIRRRV